MGTVTDGCFCETACCGFSCAMLPLLQGRGFKLSYKCEVCGCVQKEDGRHRSGSNPGFRGAVRMRPMRASSTCACRPHRQTRPFFHEEERRALELGDCPPRLDGQRQQRGRPVPRCKGLQPCTQTELTKICRRGNTTARGRRLRRAGKRREGLLDGVWQFMRLRRRILLAPGLICKLMRDLAHTHTHASAHSTRVCISSSPSNLNFLIILAFGAVFFTLVLSLSLLLSLFLLVFATNSLQGLTANRVAAESFLLLGYRPYFAK